MKKSIILGFCVLVSSVYAGKYIDSCYDQGLHKQEVYQCLDTLEQEANIKIKYVLKALQKKSLELAGSKDSYRYVTSKQIQKLQYAQEIYSNEVCKLLGAAIGGTGEGQEAQDCIINQKMKFVDDIKFMIKDKY
jgi:hypothetical protein